MLPTHGEKHSGAHRLVFPQELPRPKFICPVSGHIGSVSRTNSHAERAVLVAVVAVVWLLHILQGTWCRWMSQAPYAGSSTPSTICVHFSGCDATYDFILWSKYVTELLPSHSWTLELLPMPVSVHGDWFLVTSHLWENMCF